MSAVDVNAMMDAVGVRLATIAGLRVYDYRADKVAAPAAIVGLPTEVDYNWTKGGGSDRVVIPVVLLVQRVSDRASRDLIGPYLSGTGAKSIEAAVNGTLGGTAQVAWVSNPEIRDVTMGDIAYVGVTFDVEVIS
jgi:hypothetical protein